tara:strand:+ start:537 stop:1181 length:645 start_codon:yes stop_codon:yes gene_type:complete
MWAIVKASQVIQVVSSPQKIVVNNLGYPSTIFTHWTKTALKEIGVYQVIEGTQPDTRFETGGAVSYTVDDDKGTVTETITLKNKSIADTLWTEQDKKDGAIPDDEDVGDVATKGLKTIYTEQIQQQASALLQPTDWLIVRKSEDSSKSIPSAVTTFRASVRTKSDSIISSIAGCSSLAKLKELFVTELNSDGSVKTVATMDSLPSDKDVASYKR